MLIMAVLGVGGFLGWQWWQRQQPAPRGGTAVAGGARTADAMKPAYRSSTDAPSTGAPVTAAALQMAARPPAPFDPFLKAAGTDLRNDRGKGDVVPLRGVNLGAWLVIEHWMAPLDAGGTKDLWTALDILEERFGLAEAERLLAIYQDTWIQDRDFDRIAALGMNVVRVPFWYRTLQHRDGTWRGDAFRRLDWVVAAAWKRGIYTVIDLHGPKAPQRANAHCTGHIVPEATLWKDPAAQQEVVDLWAGIAKHYAGNPAIAGYDLLNEPMDVPSREANADLLGRCYDAIRAVDPDHNIIMEATFHSWNFKVLPRPQDRGWTNVSYQYHVYPWGSWNDAEGIRQQVQATIDDWNAHAEWSVPAQIGEFNMGVRSGWDSAVTGYSTAGMSWMMWAYKTSSHSTWGVYIPDGIKNAVPDLRKDSAERIAACWGSWSTDHYRINDMVGGAVAMPVAVDEAYDAPATGPLTVADPGVLANDPRLNPDGSAVSLTVGVERQPRYGELTMNPEGGFTYQPKPGFRGYDTFGYRVNDGRTSSVRVATCQILVP